MASGSGKFTPSPARAALSSSNFLGALPGRTALYNAVLPLTHDTGSFAYTRGKFISDLNLTTLIQAQEERADYKAQLENGIRFWDLRLTKTSDQKGRNLDIYHGAVDVGSTLDEAFGAARDFLQRNPGETLVISLKRENPFKGAATSEIDASDIQAYLDNFATNASLPAGRNGLWVAGHKDFEAIKAARETNGLADLNKAGSGFELETRNPRTNPGVKLNYESLTLGDVRGKIILHMRDFSGYDNWSDSTIAALDSGGARGFSSGVYMQDNYLGPTYTQKKVDILSHAKGLYANGDPATRNKRFAWNFTSATTGIMGGWPKEWQVNPATFALTINSGPARWNYRTNDSVNPLRPKRSASLKTMLSPTGGFTRWNVAQKRLGNVGLRGAVGGDYMLAPPSWYEDFWNSSLYSRKTLFPNLNSSKYTVSDALNQRLWRQSALAVPVLDGTVEDPLTGLPTYLESQSGGMRLQSFLGNVDKRGLKVQVDRVTAEQAGLSADQIAAIPQASLTTPVTVDYQTIKGSRRAFFVNRKTRATIVRNFDAARLSFTLPATPGTDGYSFFRIDLLDPTSNARTIAPTFFAVTDTL